MINYDLTFLLKVYRKQNALYQKLNLTVRKNALPETASRYLYPLFMEISLILQNLAQKSSS